MKTTIELTAQIVTAQAATRVIMPDEMADLVSATHKALRQCTSVEDGDTKVVGLKSDPMSSIGRHEITCLECGKSFKLLANRHLALHGLLPRSYKEKWDIPMTTPLSSRALTARRRKLAKDMGMGKGLAEWRRQNAMTDRERLLEQAGMTEDEAAWMG